MTQEEKAKRYDEAFERAKNFIENGDERERTIAESIFAGIMEESDDERIRKAIINIFATHKDYEIFFGASVKDIITWLEKQGQNTMSISEATKQKLEDNLNKALEKETPESWNEFLEKQGEQKPTAWSEEDEKKRKGLIKGLEDRMGFGWASDPFSREEYIDWLKSLRPQSHWKPSDEQMEALWNVYRGGKEQAELATLYNDLKKLKG